MSKERHPLAGQVRPLRSATTDLHRRKFLIGDWFSNLPPEQEGLRPELINDIVARGQQGQCPLSHSDTAYFEGWTVFGHLGGSPDGKMILVDLNEIFDVQESMSDGFDRLFAFGRCRALNLQKRFGELLSQLDYCTQLSPVRPSSLNELLEEIVKELSNRKFAYDTAGIARLQQTAEKALYLHQEMSKLYFKTRRHYSQALARSSQYGLSMTTHQYRSHFGFMPGHESNLKELDAIKNCLGALHELCHDSATRITLSIGGGSATIGLSTSTYDLTTFLTEFASNVTDRFYLLTDWQSRIR